MRGTTHSKTIAVVSTILAIQLFLDLAAFPLMTVMEGGRWPQNWPEELEPLRKGAKTCDFRGGLSGDHLSHTVQL